MGKQRKWTRELSNGAFQTQWFTLVAAMDKTVNAFPSIYMRRSKNLMVRKLWGQGLSSSVAFTSYAALGKLLPLSVPPFSQL